MAWADEAAWMQVVWRECILILAAAIANAARVLLLTRNSPAHGDNSGSCDVYNFSCGHMCTQSAGLSRSPII